MKKKKRSRKKQKQPEKKLKPIDCRLYCLIFSLLALLFFILPPTIETFRSHMILSNPDILAFSDGPGIFWMVVPALIGAVGTVYFAFAVSDKMSVKEAMAFVFRKKISAVIVVLCLVIYPVSFSLSLFSPRCELRTDGFYDCSILGSEKIGDISSAQKVKWEFAASGIRQSMVITLDCSVTINGEEKGFRPLDPERVLAVNDTLSGIPAEIVDDFRFEKWLMNYEIDDDMREKLYEIFVYSEK